VHDPHTAYSRNHQALNSTMTNKQQKRDAERLALERLATKRAPASAAAPEAADPEAADPEAAIPEAASPEAAAPEAAAPEAATPEVAAPEAVAPEAALTFSKEHWTGLFGDIFDVTEVTFISYHMRARPKRLPFPLQQPPEPIPPSQAELEDRLAKSMARFLASYEEVEPKRWAHALGKGNRPPLAEAAKMELSPEELARKALERLAAAAPAR
jgi:hypothetical protein